MILVRHAQPVIEPSVAPVDWRLSDHGRAEALALAERVRPLAPDAVYTSPERKAWQTGEILAAALALPCSVVDDLREHDRTGVPFLGSQDEFERRVRGLFATPGERVFGNESAGECAARFRRAIAEVLRRGDAQPLVVSHGTILSTYIAARTSQDAADVWQQMRTACHFLFPHAEDAVTPS